MKVELWLVGKTRESWVSQAIEHYLKRCNRYATISIEVVPESKSTNPDELRADETARLIHKLKKSAKAYTIILDEHGKQMSSVQFAQLIDKQKTIGSLRFVIGGAYGMDHSIHKEADMVVALSGMTFPHQLVRIIFMEQLYRAFTILRGEGYHH